VSREAPVEVVTTPRAARQPFSLTTVEQARKQLARYGVLVVIAATFAVFSLLRPDSFFTALTIKGILRDSVPLLIVGLGITSVLAMNDYDLSVGGLVSLCATLVVVFLSTDWLSLNWIVAMFLTLAVGGLLGLANGVLIAYVRLPSFILTIASGTVFAGLALEIVSSQSV
jgi:ribose transport system permease protein